jgi:hypothetical protein
MEVKCSSSTKGTADRKGAIRDEGGHLRRRGGRGRVAGVVQENPMNRALITALLRNNYVWRMPRSVHDANGSSDIGIVARARLGMKHCARLLAIHAGIEVMDELRARTH